MGFRFRKSISVLPGIKINLNRRSTSLSIGGRGAHVTIGGGKVRETIGLPGTGISYTHTSHKTAAERPGRAHPAPVAEPPENEELPKGVAWRGWAWILIAVLIVGALVVKAMR